ncbi:MAG: hypothetical protein LBI06_07110 [Treponema sp.]|jgi:hypothetical protein|nr:hypothetical protein [Treponema sp.]
MHRFCLAILLSCLLVSCTGKEAAGTNAANAPPSVEAAAALSTPAPPALSAFLQAGEFPLWFQFSAEGPALIDSIEDACFSAALVPWPLALHVRFMLAQGNDLLMAVNGEGFIRLSPWRGGEQIGLYRFSGGEFWRQYTVGAFVLLDEKPLALLYRDDRFIDSSALLPSPRLWTFDMHSSGMKPLSVPSLDAFSPQDEWDIDTLRRGSDGFWYFRATKKVEDQPELLMLRSGDLIQKGERITLGPFQSAALPEPLSAAPYALQEMLATAFAETGTGLAAVVSPEFKTARTFAADREMAAVFGFYSGNSLLAIFPSGEAFYLETGAAIRRFSLYPLPEGFVYTGIAMCGQTIVASWEEQDEYSIGAAGFMVIKFLLAK